MLVTEIRPHLVLIWSEIILCDLFYTSIFVVIVPTMAPENPLLPIIGGSMISQFLLSIGINVLDNPVIAGLIFGALLGLGSMIGDLCGSFLKRRKNIES